MKKLWQWVRVLVLVLLSIFVLGGKKSDKKSEPYHTVQKYNKEARWVWEECTFCSGTGMVSKKYYNHRRNRTTIIVEPCKYCNGTGRRGRSKK